MKKILIISPYIGRAGAEMYLYRFLNNYDANQLQVMVVTEKYAPLFAALEPKIKYTWMKKKSPLLTARKAINRIVSALGGSEKLNTFELFVEGVHLDFKPDHWVLNTLVMQKVIRSAKRMNARTTVLVHEMPSAYAFISEQAMRSLMTTGGDIISNSKACCRAIADMGRGDVKLQPAFVDFKEIELRADRAVMRDALKIAPSEFVLVASGSLDYNKGVELFIKISAIAINRPWKFIWIGQKRKTGFNYYIEQYIEAQKTAGNLMFVGEKDSDYYDYLNVADAFLLTSFNESFSLASLEALALGKPIIAYDCGGVSDFLSDECGYILKTRSPQDWVETIELLQQHYAKYQIEKLKDIASFYSVENQVPSLTALLAAPRE